MTEPEKQNTETAEQHRQEEKAALYRRQDEDFGRWASGYGLIQHSDLTQVRVWQMLERLHLRHPERSRADMLNVLAAGDRVASATCWLTVHMTYAKNVHLNGAVMQADDFKETPEGHTGGALNMAIGYVAYLTANALTGQTRSWLMGQGHCVAAIDAANLIVGNQEPDRDDRYPFTEKGLRRFVGDFYSYEQAQDGKPASPLGSHVNPHTAGGIMEGGYLGFAQLQYMHMPLPGERLVAFLSDGAWEEQRGSDWSPRWWRHQDTGLVAPIMINNGRRIDQRTSMTLQGGAEWFSRHLELNGFDPILLDGRDPGSMAWGILEMEERLASAGRAIEDKHYDYPAKMPYGIAETTKGWGFPGAGKNRAHNLPLSGNPFTDKDARKEFNQGVKDLFVAQERLQQSVALLNSHEAQGRVREKDHALATRNPAAPNLPEPNWVDPQQLDKTSAMGAVDGYLLEVLKSNPELRVRAGNPDEMRSNKLGQVLDFLKHRVSSPEKGIAEDVLGSVITALNEEAVVCAALANKAGLNLVATYEAFGVKMLGALRQEIIFARHSHEAGREPRWLSVPLFLSSHTWENGKNEQSHQDPTLAEALMGEMADTSRVMYPADANAAMACVRACYQTRGQIWTMVTSKRDTSLRLDHHQAEALVRDGALRLKGKGDEGLMLCATGAYQLEEVLKASWRLEENNQDHSVVYLQEPSRFRIPRDGREATMTQSGKTLEHILTPASKARVFVTHTRPEPFLGLIRPLDTGPDHTQVLGYINQGGTLDAAGMMFANRCTWAHVLAACAETLHRPVGDFLKPDECAAIEHRGDPRLITHPS